MTLLYNIPPALLMLLALAITILLAGAGQLFVHRRFSRPDFIAHNEVGGIMMAVSGTLQSGALLKAR